MFVLADRRNPSPCHYHIRPIFPADGSEEPSHIAIDLNTPVSCSGAGKADVSMPIIQKRKSVIYRVAVFNDKGACIFVEVNR